MSKITCQLCQEQVHSIAMHLKRDHNDKITLDEYKADYPDAPLLSVEAQEALDKRRQELQEQAKTQMLGASTVEAQHEVIQMPNVQPDRSVAMHEHFGIRKQANVLRPNGDPMAVTVLGKSSHSEHIPDHDPNYVWNIDLLKIVLMSLEVNIPMMLWGHAGTGKTTVIEQVCHYTNRPMIRVQHTSNMIESDVLGQWTVKNGETIFELGPLPLAMMHGWVYLADEYDFAVPHVLSVYQPVLEGKALIIKEAPEALRKIIPHKNFRFAGTGNTNGSGDETGLYQGANLQNAANYSRFGVTEEVGYMSAKTEIVIVQQQAGVLESHAKELVTWANEIRKAYPNEIGATVGPRELIYAGKVGALKGSMREGVRLAITNRMTEVDREIAEDTAQRFLSN